MIYLISSEVATGRGCIWYVLLQVQHLSDVKTFQEKGCLQTSITYQGLFSKANCTKVGTSTATFNPLHWKVIGLRDHRPGINMHQVKSEDQFTPTCTKMYRKIKACTFLSILYTFQCMPTSIDICTVLWCE